MNYSPARLIVVFFLAVMILGTALLSLPFCRSVDQPFSLIANFFTATSALCVTGLSVVDIGSYYSLAGQIVILLLIQVGGLGYMTLSTILGIFLGRISIKERTIVKEVVDIDSYAGVLHLLKRIVLLVLLIEGIGAAILAGFFYYPMGAVKAVYYGIFHSVSAFCNAGYSIFPTNLEQFANNYLVLTVMAALIVLGGIGFLVLVEVYNLNRKPGRLMSLQTKIVLVTTGFLIVAGTIIFWISETNNVLSGQNPFFCFFNSLFHSVTARTAGFDSISEGLTNGFTGITTIILMFIGASPGGTGGGIKTVTFFLVILFAYNMIRGNESFNASGRRVPNDIIYKALAITILSVLTVGLFTFILIPLEGLVPLDTLFEVTSAFGTVGLSRGITPYLSNSGKLLIIAVMLIGRIGILTILIAFFYKPVKSSIQYPEEKVMVG